MRKIMYIESKSEGLDGSGRIGWVQFTKSKRGYRYAGRLLLRCEGYKYNCIDAETGERFWVSGPKRNGADKLYSGLVDIDADARLDYWNEVRKMPQYAHLTSYRG